MTLLFTLACSAACILVYTCNTHTHALAAAKVVRPSPLITFCDTSPATSRRSALTSPWPGICYYGGEAARVIWMNETNTYYDGVDGLPYTKHIYVFIKRTIICKP